MQARLVATRGTVVIRVVVVSVDFKCPTITKAKGQTRPYVSGEVPVKGEGSGDGHGSPAVPRVELELVEGLRRKLDGRNFGL